MHMNNSESVTMSHETISMRKSMDVLPVDMALSMKQTELNSVRARTPSTSRISTPRTTAVPLQEKHLTKPTNSFLVEARRWAQQTRDITYSNLILANEELVQQIPTRRITGHLRKLPDIDTQILLKAAKSQSSQEVLYEIFIPILISRLISLSTLNFSVVNCKINDWYSVLTLIS